VQDVALVPVDTETAALAPVSHLGVLNRDATILGDAPPHGRRPIGRALDILVTDPARHGERILARLVGLVQGALDRAERVQPGHQPA
jgi:hypothetical protein